MRDAKDGITSLAVTDHEIVTGSVDCKVRRYDIRANRLFSDFIGGINALPMYKVLPKISENLNIPRKPLALRTCAAGCLFLYLSTNSLATGIFISARVSEFRLFSLHHFHECLRISKWQELRSKELALNFASSSTKLQLRPTEC